MTVEFRQITNKRQFDNLPSGAIFEMGGSYYIKMAWGIYLSEEDMNYNAVDIESGCPVSFDKADNVIEYPTAKTVIE